MLTSALESFTKRHCISWLSDDRHFGAILPADKAWGDEYWRPRMLEVGWKSWAMVLPEKTSGQMILKKMVEEYMDLGVSASYHTDPESAFNWLLAQNSLSAAG